MKNFLIKLFLIFLGVIWMVSCKDSDNDNDIGIPYNPSKPTELLTFYPDSGKYLEKVILTGSNFGNKASDVKVYFNSRRAAVIGIDGTNMYVLAPRLPGDTCTLSVVIGKDSLIYPNPFYYKTSVTVTTIAGNGNMDDFHVGPLGEAVFQPRYLCVDKDNNVFISNWNEPRTNQYYLRLNEEENEVSILTRGFDANAPAADPVTGIIQFPTEITVGSFYTLDPMEYWAPRVREMRFAEGTPLPTNGWKHSMAVNPVDGYIYTRYYFGQITKINPKTYEAEFIYSTPQGDSYGLTFNPLRPNILYIAMWDNGGDYANSICTLDVTDPANTFKRASSNVISGGHRDGALSIAQFKQPAQIYCDNDGNIYVADFGNHCIRRITPENMVETILGVPGRAGWKDGTKEEALFNGPRGIGVSTDGSVYVADYWNGRVRKLSIN